MIHKNCLDAKVAGRNRMNRELNRLVPAVQLALIPFLNKKVLIAGNQLARKVRHTMNPFLDTLNPIQVWYNSSEYDICFGLRLSERYERIGRDERSVTIEDYMYLGQIQNGILIKLLDFELRRTDYDAATVIADRAAYEQADEIARKAKAKLNLFGEHDNF